MAIQDAIRDLTKIISEGEDSQGTTPSIDYTPITIQYTNGTDAEPTMWAYNLVEDINDIDIDEIVFDLKDENGEWITSGGVQTKNLYIIGNPMLLFKVGNDRTLTFAVSDDDPLALSSTVLPYGTFEYGAFDIYCISDIKNYIENNEIVLNIAVTNPLA